MKKIYAANDSDFCLTSRQNLWKLRQQKFLEGFCAIEKKYQCKPVYMTGTVFSPLKKCHNCLLGSDSSRQGLQFKHILSQKDLFTYFILFAGNYMRFVVEETLRSQKRVSDHLKLRLQVAVSHCVGVKNCNSILRKSSRYS